jgi:hypothetical protein
MAIDTSVLDSSRVGQAGQPGNQPIYFNCIELKPCHAKASSSLISALPTTSR